MSGRFRLGIVLRLREMTEESARIDLGHAVDAHQRAVAQVEASQGRAGEELRWLSDLQCSRAAAGELQAAVLAVATAQRAIVVSQEKLSKATAAVFDARRILAEATKQREVVERLRDRFLAEERRVRDRLDTLAMAEIASTQHAIRAARRS
jgi:flagellar export protein FliJ